MSYSQFAAAIEYPGRPEACAALVGFEGFAGLGATELEELYTRTFDINPVCTLEIGWHLYGEDYARGAFLVEMRGRMRELGVEEGTELPDHLGSVLRVLGRLDGEAADRLATGFVLPAIVRMLAGFTDDANPYRKVIEKVDAFLRERHGEPAEWAAPIETQPYSCGGCDGIR